MTYKQLYQLLRNMPEESLNKNVTISFPIQEVDEPLQPIDYISIEVRNVGSWEERTPVLLLKTEYPIIVENYNSNQ